MGAGSTVTQRAECSSLCFLLFSIFHTSLIFSYPSSRSPPISAVAFPFSCVLDVFLPQLSLLVYLYPSLPSDQPISSCFSPIFLLGCIASHPLSSSPSFFCPPSLFLLFDEPSCSHKLLLLLFCQRHCPR